MRHRPRERHARAKEVLEQVGLGDKLRNRPNQLSGGQQQRVSIARALVRNPAVILADEPTGALDSHTGREVLGMLQQMHDEGHTVVLITHDNSIAVQADRIIVWRTGGWSTMAMPMHRKPWCSPRCCRKRRMRRRKHDH